MDKVKSTIEGLKSTSSARVQETLLKIRSNVIINDAGIKLFRQSGGLDLLVPHLRKPNERILDIALSILGNCCLEEESSLAVGKLNSFGPLVSILKTVCRDSIVGRACRVIGNLAQRTSNAEGLHNHGAVTALVALIENRDKNTSYPTLTMAVRAIRQLWMVIDKREEMLALNAVRCIAILVTTECESAGIIKSTNPARETEGFRKSQEELVIGILKCLGYFTTHATAQCAEQIQGDGRGYQSLVALTKLYESLALKCLMNLCYLSPCRPLLGTAGLVECLVGILQKISEVLWWPEGAARALAQLSGESVNRSRLRHCGGLPLLVAAAREHPCAMHALLQYVFDDTSFQILVNEGLISLLTDELTKYLGTMDIEHNNTENTNKLNETTEPLVDKKLRTELKVEEKEAPKNVEAKSCLFLRRKSHLAKNEDELKVVIERDNMIVGFIDAVDSDASDESQSEDDSGAPKRKGTKRARSGSPKLAQNKPQLIKMANKDWSAGVYWEPKSPEWPITCQPLGSRGALSPDRSEYGPMSPYSDENQSGFSPEYRGFSNKRARWDRSPESGFSTGEGSSASPYWTEYQWSPSSSGSPTSPLSVNEDSSDSEISGRYSPVCSETDDAVNIAPRSSAAELDAAQVAHDLDELIMEDDDSVEEETPLSEEANKLDMSTKSSRIACVLVLLFRVSHGACNFHGAREEPVPNHTMELLTGKECLNALLDYVERCKRPLGRAARILARVLSNALCLMNILRHRLALRLHSMTVSSKHPPAKCQQCKQIVRLSAKLLVQLTILAESSYGIGEISYQLLKGNSSMKQTLALTLPYIVRTEKALKKYFIDCSALNFLFANISESKEDIQDCVTAIVKLASNVHIKDPKSLESRFKDQVYVSYDPVLDNLSVDEVVTFQLDDLSLVKANKVFLCQNSEYFSAMLMGCFKESVEKCVRLTDVSRPALEYLFTLLHCGLNNPQCEIQIFPMAEDLETNLEVLLLADRYLLDRLKELMSSAILQFQLTPENADKIYVWSLSKGMGFLCVESVAYLLTGKMCETARARSFQTILSLEYKDQWLDDIKSMIRRQLVK
ncbi:armadillo repeat-containing protein 5 isoform X1 [Amyelois transitella]|uniref:armadillo repeat-containing protein 5 isoform X1 n=1 Tax=Amyelois transitella TaxID=680683 RepID=UPI00298F985D|nr:armadillo repeat-containing protein 5 isoform X1 [Amyelois transitella]